MLERRKDGTSLRIDLSLTPLEFEGDIYVLAAVRDIHDRVLADELVQAERERLRSAMNSMLDPHVMLEAVRDESERIVDFVYTDANPAACAYDGLDYQDLVGARLLELLPGHASTGLLEYYRQVVETGEPLVLDDFVYSQELLGGVERYYDVRAVRVGDGLSYTWRDVTDRNTYAAALAASESRYRLVAENAADAVFLLDPAGVVKWVSPGVQQVLGYDATALVGTDATDLVHPDGLQLLRSLRARAASGEKAVTYELQLRTATGQYRWMSGTTGPALDADGITVGRVTTMRDCHEQVLAAQALAESEQRYRLLAENSSDVVFLADQQMVIHWISASVTQTLGWQPKDLVDHHSGEFIHSDDLSALRGAVAGSAGGELIKEEVRWRCADGSYRWMLGSGRLVTSRDGAVAGRVVSLRDIHDMVLAREELAASERPYRDAGHSGRGGHPGAGGARS